jgi:hypothetical protein
MFSVDQHSEQPCCGIKLCHGTLWNSTDLCWFHYLADVGVEARFSSEELEFGLFTTRTLKEGTRFPYLGVISKVMTPFSIQVTKTTILDASELHSCPARYLNYAPKSVANCKWVNGINGKPPFAELIKTVNAGDELTIPYRHNERRFA